MAIIGIVAVDRNGAIGKAGGLPWHYSSDLKFFKEQTTGHAVVMGYKTWITLKKPLPNRLNIVLTKRADVEPRESVVWLRDRQSVLALKDYLTCDLFVIGGAQIFAAFLADVDRWLVTEVPIAVEDADTFMPPNFLEGFRAYDSRTVDEGVKVSFFER